MPGNRPSPPPDRGSPSLPPPWSSPKSPCPPAISPVALTRVALRPQKRRSEASPSPCPQLEREAPKLPISFSQGQCGVVGRAGCSGAEESPGEQYPAGVPGEARCAQGDHRWYPQPEDCWTRFAGGQRTKTAKSLCSWTRGAGVEREREGMCMNGKGLHQ